MKKMKLIVGILSLTFVMGAAVLATGCKSTHDHQEGSSGHVHQYSCPHHPEVVQTSAGNCPKCGMKLVHKD